MAKWVVLLALFAGISGCGESECEKWASKNKCQDFPPGSKLQETCVKVNAKHCERLKK